MKKYGFLTLILCLFCLGEAAVASPGKADAAPAAQAQSSKLTVKGFVKDDKGDPMIGVTLIVKGTNFGTVSNADGSYSIDVPYGGATLMVSYIGYAPQEINVNNRTKIDITLLEDSKALEEVVVVGYNVQKKETITGSIATITTKDLKQSPTANINNALAGRMPGLLVNQFSGGEPGNDAAQLNIRGISTYGQSGVIMIVDGIERDMSYLAPDEIETFTILKDASATAPYGIRGANGVIVVTTKRGRKGEKPTVDFKASVGISEPIRYPDYLGSADYATLYNEAMLNDNPSLAAFALHADGDRQLPPRQRRQLRRAGLQLGLFRLCVPALGIAGLQPLGTRRHGPRPLLHPGKLLQAGRQLQALQLRQRQQLPAL